MRIAHCVESYLPAKGGMVEVVRQLSERMVRMGHAVTVFTSTHPERTSTSLHGVEIRSFGIRGNAVDGITGRSDAYVSELINGGFDVVVFFAAQQWATDAALPRLAQIRGKKVLVPTGFSALNDPAWTSYFAEMPGWLAQMDLNIFHSLTYQDARFAAAHGIRQVAQIPNGASEEEFSAAAGPSIRRALGLQEDEAVIVHVGSYTGLKGHKEAMRIFLDARVDATLLFIGNGVPELERLFHRHWRFLPLRWRRSLGGARILFHDWDRARTVAALQQADLMLFPSQIECSPIVLFESAAAGTPFLASQAGNSEEIAQWTKAGWTVGGSRDALGRTHIDIGAAARELKKLLADRVALRKAGDAGREAWRDRFTWRHIADHYLQEYERLVNPHG